MLSFFEIFGAGKNRLFHSAEDAHDGCVNLSGGAVFEGEGFVVEFEFEESDACSEVFGAVDILSGGTTRFG